MKSLSARKEGITKAIAQETSIEDAASVAFEDAKTAVKGATSRPEFNELVQKQDVKKAAWRARAATTKAKLKVLHSEMKEVDEEEDVGKETLDEAKRDLVDAKEGFANAETDIADAEKSTALALKSRVNNRIVALKSEFDFDLASLKAQAAAAKQAIQTAKDAEEKSKGEKAEVKAKSELKSHQATEKSLMDPQIKEAASKATMKGYLVNREILVKEVEDARKILREKTYKSKLAAAVAAQNDANLKQIQESSKKSARAFAQANEATQKARFAGQNLESDSPSNSEVVELGNL